MTFTLPKFTDAEVEEMLTMFLTGHERIDVVDYLLKNNDKIKEASGDYDAKEFRKMLSDHLRSLDPSSNKYASGKYHIEYDNALRKHKRWISRKYDAVVLKNVDDFETELNIAAAEIAAVEKRIEAAETTTEFVQLTSLCNKLKKDSRELHDKYLERLERIHQQTLVM